MFEVNGYIYFINFSAIDKLMNLGNDENPTGKMVEEVRSKLMLNDETGELRVVEQDTNKYYRSREVDPIKYSIIQQMLNIVMPEDYIGEDDDVEDKPSSSDEQSSGYKLAFNTLLMYGIITPYIKEGER